MRISIDGGALCSSPGCQYGTHRFTVDFLKALSLYDTQNKYNIYTYCDIDRSFYLPSLSYRKVLPKTGWMKLQLTREEIFQKSDLFIGLNQSLPLYTPARTVAISHGLSFTFFPDYYKDEYGRLLTQLRTYVRHADHIIVSSQRVRDELSQLSLPVKGTVHVLPFGVPFLYQTYTKQKRQPFFLSVGSGQPVKNIDFLINTFRAFTELPNSQDVRLYIVGTKRKNIEGDRITFIPHLPPEKLKQYYQKALAYISTSLYESFNYPVCEAISQRCPVVALESALIPEHRPFVTSVANECELLAKMQDLTCYKKPDIDYTLFEQTFSWEQFVNHLTLIYN
jgi:glycosyltransferase involved in cell wall biosynthesis